MDDDTLEKERGEQIGRHFSITWKKNDLKMSNQTRNFHVIMANDVAT